MKFLVILAGLLCVSNAQTATGCAYNNQYTVQSGNTFWQLGGSTWAGMCAWLNANPGVDPCNLKIGQCVNAPVSGYTSTTCNSADLAWSCVSTLGYPTGTYYGSGYYSGPTYSTSVSSYCGYNQRQVASGDTIWNIAGQTWPNTCAWLNANPGVNPCTLQGSYF